MWWRPRDQPNGYSGKDGREKCRDRDGFMPAHLTGLLEVLAMLQAGPAIFAIDETKNGCHGINSIVDRANQAAAVMFHAHFVAGEIDVVELKIWLRGVAG